MLWQDGKSTQEAGRTMKEKPAPMSEDRDIEALRVRVELLEKALAEYAMRYGLTDLARRAFQDVSEQRSAQTKKRE